MFIPTIEARPSQSEGDLGGRDAEDNEGAQKSKAGTEAMPILLEGVSVSDFRLLFKFLSGAEW